MIQPEQVFLAVEPTICAGATLYRIEQIAARQQVPLARSTLSEWIGRLCVVLQPLSDRLADKLRERGSLHADETPVQQLAPGKGKTKRAYLWSSAATTWMATLRWWCLITKSAGAVSTRATFWQRGVVI